MSDEFEGIIELGGLAAVELAAAALVEHGRAVGKCPNCQAPLIGPYCAICGQSGNSHRRSVGGLLRAFFGEVLSFDSRILRTATALVARPGELPLAFHEGRTQRYVPAVRLYLFVTLIFFLTLSAAGIAILQLELVTINQRFVQDKNHNVFVIKNGVRERMEGFKADDKGNVYLSNPELPHNVVAAVKADGSLSETVTSRPHFFAHLGTLKGGHAPANILADMDKKLKSVNEKKPGWGTWITEHVARMFKVLATDPAAVNGPLTEWMPRVLFILLPLFALLLACFYWRQRGKFFFVDHLVFSLNMHSFGFVLLLAAAALAQFVSGEYVAMVVGLALAAYLLLAMKRFYGQGWFWTSAKFVAIGFVYGFVILPLALAGIISYSLLHL